MAWSRASFVVAVALLAVLAGASAWGRGKDAIKLQDVTALTFRDGKMSTARRGSPVPQLTCIGGDACHEHKPVTIQCRNAGFDGYDVQWRCEADLPGTVRFGTTTVTCEGYDSPEDEYVLRGSCGVEYEMWYTEDGRAKRSGRNTGAYQSGYSSYGSGGYHHSPSYYSSGSSWGTLMMLGVVCVILYYTFKACSSGRTTTYGGPGGAAPGYGGYGAPGGYGPGCGTTYTAAPATGGGFWTGAGLGGMMGYMMGRNRGYGYGYGPAYGYRAPAFGGGGGGMFGGGGARMATGTRTAAGYGGTRRR